MKKQHWITGVIALFSFLTVSYADNDTEKNKNVNTPEQTAQLMIAVLEKYVTLSGEQKDILFKKALELIQKRQEINATTKAWSEEQMAAKKAAEVTYEEAVERTLTQEQKEELTAKRELRKKEIQQRLIQSISENQIKEEIK
jgi:hypothetical protein